MSTFFDDFSQTQESTFNANTVLTNGSFGVLQQRMLEVSDSNSISINIDSGLLVFNSTVNIGAGGISYLQHETESINLENLTAITLQGQVASGSLPSIKMVVISANSGVASVTKMPIANTWTWLASEFDNGVIDLTRIIIIQFIIENQRVDDLTLQPFSNALVCVAKGTLILMADKTEKPIESIVRGDLVAADPSCNKVHKVARLTIQHLHKSSSVEMVKIRRDALGSDMPKRTLFISKNHPIMYKYKRRPAKCFRRIPGVSCYDREMKVMVSDFLPQEDDGSYRLYDLQFEVEGSYVAEGLQIQSRSPYSELTPLSKELYFTKSLYRPYRVWDSLCQPMPLDESLI